MQSELPPTIDDGAQLNVLTRPVDDREMLADFVEDYRAASTLNELMDQVHVAKEVGANSIEATPAIIRHYCRRQYPDDVGYFMFHDIKVWIEGFYQTHKDKERVTIEQRLFGKPK